MKEIRLNGISYIQALEGSEGEWYFAMDAADGDLYEAEELFRLGLPLHESRLCLVHYPDGEVICPPDARPGLAFGRPVFSDGAIAYPAVDFPAGLIRICRYDPAARVFEDIASLPLSSVENCYNLMLHTRPLTLSRQPNDGRFELLWPKRKTIVTDPKESFFLRDGDRLFFNIWFEDPDYREETVIRSAETGEILEQLPGDIFPMPDGTLWHVF